MQAGRRPERVRAFRADETFLRNQEREPGSRLHLVERGAHRGFEVVGIVGPDDVLEQRAEERLFLR